MYYAGRFNSFVLKGQTVFDAIGAYREMDGITHLEFNYPEHIRGNDLGKLREAMGPLRVNGLAMRWKSDFLEGNLTNPDESLRARAIAMTKEAVDICRKLGGSMVTLWLENDGFDYPFEVDYAKAWEMIVEAVREIADYAGDLRISIEYKPFQEREFALIDSAGMTLHLIEEVDRDNVGCTLDFCHMLMKHDSPAYGLALAAEKGKLYGLHMNDGYGVQDSGLIFGSVNFSQAAEFIYYLEKYQYDGVVFFDTFPIREDSRQECQANIQAFELIRRKVERAGIEHIDQVVSEHSGISAQRLILDMLR